ncbi:MAG: PKD domain-containing protein [Flavisolibacter sp.]
MAKSFFIYLLVVAIGITFCRKDDASISFTEHNNKAPEVSAGNDINLQWPVNYCTIEGSAIDPESERLRFVWDKLTGPANYIINDRFLAKTIVSNLDVGEYTFQFSATDLQGNISRDTVRISVIEEPTPLVQAGNNVYLPLPQNSCKLTGFIVNGGGFIINYSWRKVSGPASYVIANPDNINTMITGLEQGDYQFEFAATNNNGFVGRDTVDVYVYKPGENEVIFNGLQWQCPMGCTVMVKEFYGYVPQTSGIAVYIRESSSSDWLPIKHESQWTPSDVYSWSITNGTFLIYANDATGEVDVKIKF